MLSIIGIQIRVVECSISIDHTAREALKPTWQRTDLEGLTFVSDLYHSETSSVLGPMLDHLLISCAR